MSLLISFASFVRRWRSLIVFWFLFYHDVDKINLKAILFYMFFKMTFVTYNFVYWDFCFKFIKSFVTRSRMKIMILIDLIFAMRMIELRMMIEMIWFIKWKLNFIFKIFEWFNLMLIFFIEVIVVEMIYVIFARAFHCRLLYNNLNQYLFTSMQDVVDIENFIF